MRITVVGTGYVGLVTGCCFADLGNVVTCVDVNRKKVLPMLVARTAASKATGFGAFALGFGFAITRSLRQ